MFQVCLVYPTPWSRAVGLVIGENGGECQRFSIRQLLPASVWEDQ
jgi:hypothetical protein